MNQLESCLFALGEEIGYALYTYGDWDDVWTEVNGNDVFENLSEEYGFTFEEVMCVLGYVGSDFSREDFQEFMSSLIDYEATKLDENEPNQRALLQGLQAAYDKVQEEFEDEDDYEEDDEEDEGNSYYEEDEY